MTRAELGHLLSTSLPLKPKDLVGGPRGYYSPRLVGPELIEELLEVLARVPLAHCAGDVVSGLLDAPQVFRLREALLPAALRLAARRGLSCLQRPGLVNLLAELRAFLVEETSSEPVAPRDWSRAYESCGCEDCEMLAEFMADPVGKKRRFPLNESRRQHLEGRMKRQNADTECLTIREGRPYTLQITKTQSSYDRALSQYRGDRQKLTELGG